jgi:hypothetical protein
VDLNGPPVDQDTASFKGRIAMGANAGDVHPINGFLLLLTLLVSQRPNGVIGTKAFQSIKTHVFACELTE